MTNIPVSSDYRVTARKIYRTIASSPSFYFKLLATISDNTTTTYSDNTADAGLTGGAAYPGFWYQENTTNSMILRNGVQSAFFGVLSTSFGRAALDSFEPIAHSNTAFGVSALTNVTTGTTNSAFGSLAGANVTTGNSNSFFGAQAGYQLTGSLNIIMGVYSAYAPSAGSFNIVIGNSAGGYTSDAIGSSNVYIGHLSGRRATGSFNTFVGANSGDFETGSSKLIIDSLDRGSEATGRAEAIIYGVMSATASDQELYLGGTGNVHLLGDNASLYFGAADDASIYYNGSHLILNPAEVGSGNVGIGLEVPTSKFHVHGAFKATNSSNTWQIKQDSGIISTLYGTTADEDAYAQVGAYNSLFNFQANSRNLNLRSDSISSIMMLEHDTGNVGIGTASPSSELQVAGEVIVDTNISVGTSSPSAGFSGAGDIYATSGIKAMEGLYAEAVAYGAGLEVADNSLGTIYTNAMYGTATLTAATRTIYDPEGDFITDGVEVGQFFKVVSSTPSFTGATGEIVGVTDATHLVLSFGSSGGDAIVDATGMSFVVYPAPNFFVGDNGNIHMSIGADEEAHFHIHNPYGNSACGVSYEGIAGVDGHTAFCIDIDADDKGGVSALGINFDATAFASSDTIGTVLDIVVANTGATAGDVHCLDVALGNPLNSDLEVEALVTHEGVDVIGQYLGDPANLGIAFEFDESGETYTDRTAAFNGAGTNVAIFDDEDDAILIASTSKFDEINVILTITASHTILPDFYYSKEAEWEEFSPADDTDGFTGNGTIRFDGNDLEDWEGQTIFEMTGSGDNVTDYYWVKITRTRSNLVRQPIEDTIQVTSLGNKFVWNKEGDVNVNTMSVVDGVTAPSAISGQAIIYVDAADGDLKVKFGDGTIKTLATDT